VQAAGEAMLALVDLALDDTRSAMETTVETLQHEPSGKLLIR